MSSTSLTVADKQKKMVTVVSACIKDRGGRQVLLSIRKAPGVKGLDEKWELPGGKIEFGETPDKTIVREIQEELGLRVRPLRLLPYLHTNIWEYDHAIQHVVLACYECEVEDSGSSTLQAGMRWCDPAEIDFETTLPGTREFISLSFNDDWFDRVCIRFKMFDPTKKAKEFTIATQPTLFSHYGLVKYWGQVGVRLRMRMQEFGSPRELDNEILETAKRRLADGYFISELQGSERTYKPLLRIVEMAKAKNQYLVADPLPKSAEAF